MEEDDCDEDEGEEEPDEEETMEEDKRGLLLDSKSKSRGLRAEVISILGDFSVCGLFLTL